MSSPLLPQGHSPAPFFTFNSRHKYGMLQGHSPSALHLAKKARNSQTSNKINSTIDQSLDDQYFMDMVPENSDKEQQQKRKDKSDDQAIISDFLGGMPSRMLMQTLPNEQLPAMQYLTTRLNINNKDLAKMLRRSSGIPKWDVNIIEAHLSYLQDRLSITNEELSKMMQKCPQIMIMGVEDKLALSLDYLQERLGLNDKELSSIVQRLPTLLNFRPQEGLEPKIQFLENRLLLDKDGLRKIANRSPTLLALSQTDNIEPKLKWLEARLDLNQEQLSRIVLTAPAMMNLSIPNKLQPTLDWLQERLNLKDDGALAAYILKAPTLCCRKIDNMSTKLDFYESLLGVDGARNLVIEVPNMFSFSLEKRLMPRLEDVEKVGIAIDYGVVQRMGLYTDVKWAKGLIYQMNKMEKVEMQDCFKKVKGGKPLS